MPVAVEKEIILPPTLSCHAPSIGFDSRGERLLAWFGGQSEGSCDCGIWLQRNDETKPLLQDDDYTSELGLAPDVPMWNPVVVPLAGQTLLFFKQGVFCDRWHTYVFMYDDNKLRSAMSLPAGTNGPVKCKPLVEGNVLVCGASSETSAGWSAYIERWELNTQNSYLLNELQPSPRILAPGAGKGLIQPALYRDYNSGKLMAFMRSCTGFLWHWTEGDTRAYSTNIPNPNSAIDVVRHPVNNKLYIALNYSSSLRLPLVVAVIDEQGFPSLTMNKVVLENFITELDGIESSLVTVNYPSGQIARRIGLSPEASYPSLAIGADEKLYCAYSYGRRAIAVAKIDPF